MSKLLFRSLILLLIGAAAGQLLPRLYRRDAGIPSGSAGPTIERVRELSALVTTSVDVADVRVTELRGWTGGVRVALLVRGQYLLGTDLAKARFESIDPQRRSAVLVLPPPEATAPRLDHEHTKLFAVTPYGLWDVVPTGRAKVAAVNAALKDAQASLAEPAAEDRPAERARRQAEVVLCSFFGSLDWRVAIRWSDRP